VDTNLNFTLARSLTFSEGQYENARMNSRPRNLLSRRNGIGIIFLDGQMKRTSFYWNQCILSCALCYLSFFLNIAIVISFSLCTRINLPSSVVTATVGWTFVACATTLVRYPLKVTSASPVAMARESTHE
jgi:hypothetical protein